MPRRTRLRARPYSPRSVSARTAAKRRAVGAVGQRSIVSSARASAARAPWQAQAPSLARRRARYPKESGGWLDSRQSADEPDPKRRFEIQQRPHAKAARAAPVDECERLPTLRCSNWFHGPRSGAAAGERDEPASQLVRVHGPEARRRDLGRFPGDRPSPATLLHGFEQPRCRVAADRRRGQCLCAPQSKVGRSHLANVAFRLSASAVLSEGCVTSAALAASAAQAAVGRAPGCGASSAAQIERRGSGSTAVRAALTGVPRAPRSVHELGQDGAEGCQVSRAPIPEIGIAKGEIARAGAFDFRSCRSHASPRSMM